MKRLFTLVLVVTISLNLFAEKVDFERAKTIATNLYYLQLKQLRSIEKEDLKLYSTFEAKQDGNLAYYIFNIEKGFVIVSADDLVEPILGFSLENSYSEKDLPPALIDLLEHYKVQIAYAIKEQTKGDENILARWELLTDIENQKYSGNCEIWPKYYSKSPLITTQWGQGTYYNFFCPLDYEKLVRVPAGCGAVAMAQVMKFWNNPIQGTGSHFHQDSDTPPGSYYSSANFGATTYNWANMPITVTDLNTSVATLIYHCGVSIDMDYGYEESGIYGLNGVEDALEDYFGYYSSADYIFQSDYSNTNWDNILRNNLDSRKPIIYCGGNNIDEGHVFVLEGYTKTIYETYSTNTYYHINWGWNGDDNGYFILADLTPSTHNFNYNQKAVVGIVHPNATYSTPPQPSTIQGACSAPYCMGETYNFSISPIDLATEYEWEVTGYPCGAYISNELNYASVYGIFPSTNTIRVRAKNGGAVGAWRTYPFVVTDCNYKSAPANSNSQNALILNEIQIFPNPAKNILTIHLSNNETTEIKIYDVKGVLCKNLFTGKDQIEINVKDLKQGIYFISFISDQQIENRRIQIIK